ncbi:MAG TPA: VCBS repeat-containing protein [Candidatus Sulfotelmatobacter sp.]|jgi:hypothetical protein|nr:VCBS repeat-containing protein [Candidatus Sulfotelmatobacter sp.]
MPATRLLRLTAAAGIASIAGTALAAPARLSLRHESIDLPGPPAAVISADLDKDGRSDLVIVAAYTKWGSIAHDRTENAIAVTEVVPALFDVREVRAFLSRPGGGYMPAGSLKLPPGVFAMQAGPPEHPVLALTEEGISELTWTSSPSGGDLALSPLLAEPSALAGSRSFLSDFPFLVDVDGDGTLDAVIPGWDGLAIHRGLPGGGFSAEATFRGRLPDDERFGANGQAVRSIPSPSFFDVDGDKIPDLVIDERRGAPQRVAIAKGLGEARFAPPRWISFACLAAPTPPPARPRRGDNGPGIEPLRVAWFGDLDGDGRADIVTREGIDTGKSEMKQAKKPQMRYRVFGLRPDGTVDPVAKTTFDAEGYAFSGAFGDRDDLEFIDLDHDGRKDLVTITLDFSIFQALRAITSKRIGIGLEFHVFAQQADGSFRLVPDQTLEETLNLDLNHLEISRLGQFQGDFDGDGRVDFVHLGKGKSVTIHRGEPGARYPAKPDLQVTLDQEPEDVMLVRVRDLDGDGRADIAITRTHDAGEAGTTAPVTLELYLSGGGR